MSSMNTDPVELRNVGNAMIDVAQEVRTNFMDVDATATHVTTNSVWSGLAKIAFEKKYNELKPKFEEDLKRLEELGPTLIGIANNYESFDEESANSTR